MNKEFIAKLCQILDPFEESNNSKNMRTGDFLWHRAITMYKNGADENEIITTTRRFVEQCAIFLALS